MSAAAGTAILLRELEERRAVIEDALAAVAAGIHGDDPVSAAVRYAIATGGKRLRPVLCLAAADAVRAAPAAHVLPRGRAAAALELIHTYSLVHDDLPCMDDDDLRRGRATTHRVFGTPAAALAGFALIPLACRVLLEAAAEIQLPPGTRAALLSELCAAAGAAGMVGGQVLDLEAEGVAQGRTSLRRIHGMKTGALFRAALRMGGLLGGATQAAIDALGDFGRGLGLAFQITDDVLDDTMDAEALGKTPGKDREAHKSTFTALLGVAGAQQVARAEAEAAIARLRQAGIESPFLHGLARFAVERDR